MKKIFTLVAGTLIVASSFAQYKSNDGYNKNDNGAYNNNSYKKDDGAYNNNSYKKDNRNDNYYSFGARERDMQIDKINREYNWKIQDLNRKFYGTRFRKDQMMRQLENERRFEIKKVYDRFGDRNNHWDDHRDGRH